MPLISDPPPEDVLRDLRKLRDDLDQVIPAKSLDRNLLIATWNIRAFGGLQPKWKSDPEKEEPKRDMHALHAIAEIIARFDVVALQEVKGDHTSLRALLQILGPDWGVLLSDATRGDPGNQERMAFIFDSRQVLLSGLACELVLAEEQLEALRGLGGGKQFARTPYAVGFRSRVTDQYFTLVTLHILWGSTVGERLPELKAIADWLLEWVKVKHAWDTNLIVLGDFNISSKNSSTFKAFTSTGLHIPERFFELPRTIDQKAGEPLRLYDQIAWFSGQGEEPDGAPGLELNFASCGNYEFSRATLASKKLSRDDLSWYLSDHYPLWVEFSLRDE